MIFTNCTVLVFCDANIFIAVKKVYQAIINKLTKKINAVKKNKTQAWL